MLVVYVGAGAKPAQTARIRKLPSPDDVPAVAPIVAAHPKQAFVWFAGGHTVYPPSRRASLLARGLSNRAIGAELFISETTVKFHVGNLMRKLMVSRRAEAVYAATKLGLL